MDTSKFFNEIERTKEIEQSLIETLYKNGLLSFKDYMDRSTPVIFLEDDGNSIDEKWLFQELLKSQRITFETLQENNFKVSIAVLRKYGFSNEEISLLWVHGLVEIDNHKIIETLVHKGLLRFEHLFPNGSLLIVSPSFTSASVMDFLERYPVSIEELRKRGFQVSRVALKETGLHFIEIQQLKIHGLVEDTAEDRIIEILTDSGLLTLEGLQSLDLPNFTGDQVFRELEKNTSGQQSIKKLIQEEVVTVAMLEQGGLYIPLTEALEAGLSALEIDLLDIYGLIYIPGMDPAIDKAMGITLNVAPLERDSVNAKRTQGLIRQNALATVKSFKENDRP